MAKKAGKLIPFPVSYTHKEMPGPSREFYYNEKEDSTEMEYAPKRIASYTLEDKGKMVAWDIRGVGGGFDSTTNKDNVGTDARFILYYDHVIDKAPGKDYYRLPYNSLKKESPEKTYVATMDMLKKLLPGVPVIIVSRQVPDLRVGRVYIRQDLTEAKPTINRWNDGSVSAEMMKVARIKGEKVYNKWNIDWVKTKEEYKNYREATPEEIAKYSAATMAHSKKFMEEMRQMKKRSAMRKEKKRLKA